MVTVAVVTATGAVAALQVRTECACARVRGVSTKVLDTTPAATDSHESSMTASPNHQDTLGEGRPPRAVHVMLSVPPSGIGGRTGGTGWPIPSVMISSSTGATTLSWAARVVDCASMKSTRQV